MKWRVVFVVSVIVICILSINLAFYSFITEREDRSGLPEEDIIIDTVALKENFQEIFDNTLDTQSNDIMVNKIEANQQVVYTKYQKEENKDQTYELSIHIPIINIHHDEVTKINKEINDVFYNKVENILAQANQKQVIYSVDYKAYINDNILSLVIRSNLKEGNNAQRLIIKTYNYNLSSNELLSIDKVLEYRKLNKKEVQTRINDTIEKAQASASSFQKLGYEKYLRNKNDKMYLAENTKVFFLGTNKAFYILYPYGNSNYTSELDLLVM